MKPLVKICGVKDRETAEVVEASGADFIGFLFADSKRKITVQEAKTIRAALSPAIQTVGVFRNQPFEEVNHVAATVGLDYVQLHGEESLAYINQINYPVIKAITVKDQASLEKVATYQTAVAYLLLDGPLPGSGTGFDWSLLQIDDLQVPVFLAGGLTLDNVNKALRTLPVAGVDVSSGVETKDKKDAVKIKHFINQVKGVPEQ